MGAEGVHTEWTQNLVPIEDRQVLAGQRVELHAMVDAARHTLTPGSRVRFDILEEDYRLSEAPENRVVSLLGTGATAPDETFPTETRTSHFESLPQGETVRGFVPEYVRQHRETIATDLLILEETGADHPRFHLVTWWTAARLPERLNSRFYFVVHIDDALHARHPGVLDVSSTSLQEGSIRLVLRYDDESPMGNAEFEVVQGEQRERGLTDQAGIANITLPMRDDETLRLFIHAFPQRAAAAEADEAAPDLSPEVMKNFGFDLAFPRPEVFEHLRRVKDIAQRAPGVSLLVFGHTDIVGSVSYNQGLSERRARAIFALLTDDLSMFAALASEEQWGFNCYQTMLRGLGNNPGPIDGVDGSMTQAAVWEFQEEYNQGVFHLQGRSKAYPDLVTDGDLGPKTRAALRDSYVSMAPHVQVPRFATPPWVGCSEHHPISGNDAENRRVVIAFLTQPLPDQAPETNTAGSQPPLPCQLYRQLAAEVGDEPQGSPFFDFQWLQAQGEVYLSAVTTIADETPAQFTIFQAEEAFYLPPANSSSGEEPPRMRTLLGEVSGEITNGVCTARWEPPPGYDPFKYESWLIDHDVNIEIYEAEDEAEPGENDPANATNLFNANGMSPPQFRIDVNEQWAVSEPPGQWLNRMHFVDHPGAAGTVVRSDGALQNFTAESGRVASPPATLEAYRLSHVPVLTIALLQQQVPQPGGGGGPPPVTTACARYGGFHLQNGDHEPINWNPRPAGDPEPAEADRPVYGGTPRSGNDLPAPGNIGFIHQLQADLRELGFRIAGTPDGDFGGNLESAVQEFQIQAKIPYVLQENTTLPATTPFINRLSTVPNAHPYPANGAEDGRLNDETCVALQQWLQNNYRSPCARYGGYRLQRGDGEPSGWNPRTAGGTQTAVYGGGQRSGDQLPDINNRGFIRQLQNDLETLGIRIVGTPDGDFGKLTFWAVREFQIYTKMPNTAHEDTSLPANTPYVERLSQVSNDRKYTGPISGVANPDTGSLIQYWLDNDRRCPVIVQARTGAGHVNIFNNHDNIWLHDEVTSTAPRMFVRDFSGYYTLPGFAKKEVTVLAGQAAAHIDFQPKVLPPDGSISGRVTDGAGAGVQAAQVTASNAAGVDLPTVQTDANGDFTITEVPPGQYTINVLAAGFQNPQSLNVTVEKGRESADSNFQLTASGTQVSISGRVTDGAGAGATGVAGVRVTATATGAGGVTSTVLTNANGDYAMVGLAAGTYDVSLQAPGFQNPPPANVVVQAGQPTANVDFQLTALQPASISGQVIDGTGTGVQGARVTAVNTTTGTAEPVVLTAQNGSYTIPLAPGTYTIDVQADLLFQGDHLINNHHYIVIGDYQTYLSWDGPRSVPPRHTWHEGELLPEGLVGEELAQFTQDQRSTYKVVRAVSEVECLGFFDSVNSYDNTFASLGPCHWTLGILNTGAPMDEGELCGYFAFLRHADPFAFNAAIKQFGARVDENWVNNAGIANGSRLFINGQRKYVGWMALQNESGNFIRIPENEVEGDYFRSWHWFYRYVMAGRTIQGYRQRMWDMARIRLRDLRGVPFPAGVVPNVPVGGGGTRRATLGDVYTSERAWGLLLRWHIRFTGHVVSGGEVGQRIQGAYGHANIPAAAGDPTTWGNAQETQLIDGIMQEVDDLVNAAPAGSNLRRSREGFRRTMRYVRDWPDWAAPGAQNPRGYRLTNTIGNLSTDRDSFHFDNSNLPPAP